MANFAITSVNDTLEGLNYVVSNLNQGGNANISGNVLVANTTSGEITDNATGVIISYLYQYLDVRYADNSTGTTNFSTSPTNRLYYGLRNRASGTAQSSNPADYTWFLVSGGGFSTTKFLFYNTIGGRQVQLSVTTTAPSNLWQQTIDSTPIDLDVVSATLARQLVTLSVFQRAASAPATPTGGSYNFTTLTLTPPAGWAVSIPAGTDPVYASQATFEAPESGSSAGPSGAYSAPVIIAQDGQSGTSTFIVIAYARYTSTPVTPTTNTGSWNFGTNTGTPPTATDGVTWFLFPPSGVDTLYQCQATAQVTGSSGTDTTLVWTTPVGVGSTPGSDGISVYYYSVFQNANTTPAVPTGGFFNFGTGVATPPAGWGNFPTAIANNFTFVTSAQVLTGVPTANVSIGNTWGNVVQFTGQTGSAGTNGQNGWTANVFPAVINYVMNGNGTYTTANTTVVTSFEDGTTTDTATIYSTINGVGTITINNGVISPNITVTTISNVSSKSTTVGFRHITSNSSATSLTTVSSFPFTTADAYGGQTIFGPDGTAVGTIAAAPVISTGYSAGQYFTRDTANTWTPAPAGNLITTTANVVAARGSSIQGFVNQNINYNINTGAWTTSTGSSLNPGRFGFGTPATSSTNFFNSVVYTDPDGSTTGQVQVAIIQSGLNGNSGAQGNRGFLPMAYVVTPATPIGATQANLTAWFSAARTAVTAPIGTGYTPITGDTASFTWALGANTPNAVYNFNGANTWVTATGQVINGNVIVTGTITAGQMNVNDIYALTVKGGTVTPGTFSGTGYWLQANTGNAYFGGNLVVGNSVTIGTAITSGALATNSVNSGAIQSGAVVSGKLATGAVTAGTIAAGAVTAGTIAANVVTAGTISAGAVTAGTIAAGAVTTGTMTANTINGSVILGNSITADKLVANVLQANTVVSTNATLGVIATGGFWLAGQTGSGVSAGDAWFGGNLTVGYGFSVLSGAIQNGYIGSGTIGTAQIVNNAVGTAQLGSQVVTTAKLAQGAVTTVTIADGQITAPKILAGTITGDKIAANTISATSIIANSITTTQISAAYVYAGNIISTNGSLGNTSSPGYWLRVTDGAARFGGSVSIGADLNVQGLITAGSLQANTVSTTALIKNSASQSSFGAPDFPGAYSVNFFNNTAYWPNNTRAFAISDGATIIPTSTGATNGSSVTINYTTGIFTAASTASNLVELWKTGSSSFYPNTFRAVTAAQFTNGANLNGVYSTYYAVGDNGYYAKSYDDGVTWTVSQSATFPSVQFASVAARRNSNVTITNTQVQIGADNGNTYVIQGNLTPSFNSAVASPVYNVNACVTFAWQVTGAAGFTMWVGENAKVSITGGPATWTTGSIPATVVAPTGFISSLYGIAADRSPYNTNTTNINLIAVGSGGAAMRNSMTYAGGAVFTGWTALSTGVAANLNSVWCNYTTQSSTSIGSRWCAVGDGGVILTSDNSGGTWTQRTSPTTNNLRGVCSVDNGGGVYYWCAVGDNGTLLFSQDNAVSWTVGTVPLGSDGLTRNLYGVALLNVGGWFQIVGESVIYRVYSGATNPVTAQKIYDGGAAVTSSLTRLAFLGSNSNISNVTVGGTSQQINNQVVSGTFIDTNYTAGTSTTYWLVVGNMAGANVTVSNPSISVTENKR